MTLVSPQSTRTTLLSPRPRDLSSAGLRDWALTSVQTWGEASPGTWSLYILNRCTALCDTFDSRYCR